MSVGGRRLLETQLRDFITASTQHSALYLSGSVDSGLLILRRVLLLPAERRHCGALQSEKLLHSLRGDI